MKEKGESRGGCYVIADQIDLKSLDVQLQRHLSRAWSMEKNNNKKKDDEDGSGPRGIGGAVPAARQEWEIDPSKLVIKVIIARGTYGTIHRRVYAGQDVAGSITNHVSMFVSRFFNS